MNEMIKTKKKWEVLYETIQHLNYGDVISHNEISRVIKEPYNSNKYCSIVNRAKKELLKVGKQIESVRGQGYRILNPDDYIDNGAKKFKQGFNRIKKGTEMLQYAPVNKMTDEGRSRYRNVKG